MKNLKPDEFYFLFLYRSFGTKAPRSGSIRTKQLLNLKHSDLHPKWIFHKCRCSHHNNQQLRFPIICQRQCLFSLISRTLCNRWVKLRTMGSFPLESKLKCQKLSRLRRTCSKCKKDEVSRNSLISISRISLTERSNYRYQKILCEPSIKFWSNGRR